MYSGKLLNVFLIDSYLKHIMFNFSTKWNKSNQRDCFVCGLTDTRSRNMSNKQFSFELTSENLPSGVGSGLSVWRGGCPHLLQNSAVWNISELAITSRSHVAVITIFWEILGFRVTSGDAFLTRYVHCDELVHNTQHRYSTAEIQIDYWPTLRHCRKAILAVYAQWEGNHHW